MNRAEITTAVPAAPAVPVNKIWRIIRGYILWSYERGTIQYDVMVTLILLFVLFSPVWINFHDKPIERTPHPTGVSVQPDAGGGFVYQIDGTAVTGKSDDGVRSELLRIIEPISGEVTINKVEAVRDHSGRVVLYKVWVSRE